MPSLKRNISRRLPGRFEDLVQVMIPQAIVDDVHHEHTTDMIDRLMSLPKLTKGQESYLETLVQLVQAYEASYHAIESVKGIDALKCVMAEHDLNASDLARLLGIHLSMGSKILKGERALTVEHLKILAARFKVRPDTFMD
jgi:antitoxin component HigA of HigAB toxin-antitoxin module